MNSRCSNESLVDVQLPRVRLQLLHRVQLHFRERVDVVVRIPRVLHAAQLKQSHLHRIFQIELKTSTGLSVKTNKRKTVRSNSI